MSLMRRETTMSRTSIALLLTLLAASLAPACATGTKHVSLSADPSSDGQAQAPGPQPDLGPLVRQPEPPPPISGGTLAVAPDGKTAVAADADRDRIYIVDIASRAVTFTVALPPHAEPGRVAIDDSGKAWIVLRRAGGVAVVDLATGAA
jgi:DNA-binding beta-propeller fold protein YncE